MRGVASKRENNHSVPTGSLWMQAMSRRQETLFSLIGGTTGQSTMWGLWRA